MPAAAPRDTSSYTRIQLPKAGPEVMTPPRIDKKTGRVMGSGRFTLDYTHKSNSEVQAICDYHWNGA